MKKPVGIARQIYSLSNNKRDQIVLLLRLEDSLSSCVDASCPSDGDA